MPRAVRPVRWEQRAAMRYSLYMGNLPFDFAVAHYPLAQASLYKVGGPARLALLPRTRADVVAAYDWLRTRPEPRIVLGGGSNVLIADEGFPGIDLCLLAFFLVIAAMLDIVRIRWWLR